MLIIGFGHRARQGKNTAAAAVLDSLPLDTDVMLAAFGEALRMEVRKACFLFGGAHELVRNFKESGLMPDWVHAEAEGKERTILQWWGTDYRRSQDSEYWVKRLFEKIHRCSPAVVLVTDVRFPNEADAIKAAGGVVVKVVRRGAPDVVVNEHASEAALDEYASWDYTLEAETIKELRTKAREMYAEIVRRA